MMNCFCHQPAILKDTSRGKNPGRKYFCCSSGNCEFFQWSNPSSLPPTISRPQPNSFNSSYSYGHSNTQHNSSSAGQQKPNSVSDFVKFTLVNFEGSNSLVSRPNRVWFGVIAPSSLARLFLDYPETVRVFDSGCKLWRFSMEVYRDLLTKLRTPPLDETVRVDPLPDFVVTALLKFLTHCRRLPEEPELMLEPCMVRTLKPFQLEGVKFVINRGGRAMIADEMGCGKTVQAIAVLQHYRQHWPVLVLLPVGLVKQWRRELLQFCSSLLVESDIVEMTSEGTSKSDRTGKVYLVPYTMIEKLVRLKRLRPEQFGVVVADESHNLKNRETGKASAALPFLKQACVALCLTGTPATNRPVELYAQLHGIQPDLFRDYDAFTRRYCDAKPDRFHPSVMDVKGSSHPEELNTLLTGMIMIRRLKKDVAKELPEKQREVEMVSLDPVCRQQVDKLEQQYASKERQANDNSADPETLVRLRCEMQSLRNAQYVAVGLGKLDAIKLLLREVIEQSRLNTRRAQRELQDRAKSGVSSTVSPVVANDNLASTALSKSNDVIDLCDSEVAAELEEKDCGNEVSSADSNQCVDKDVCEMKSIVIAFDDDDEKTTEVLEAIDVANSCTGICIKPERKLQTSQFLSSSDFRSGVKCTDPAAVVMQLEQDDVLMCTSPVQMFKRRIKPEFEDPLVDSDCDSGKNKNKSAGGRRRLKRGADKDGDSYHGSENMRATINAKAAEQFLPVPVRRSTRKTRPIGHRVEELPVDSVGDREEEVWDQDDDENAENCSKGIVSRSSKAAVLSSHNKNNCGSLSSRKRIFDRSDGDNNDDVWSDQVMSSGSKGATRCKGASNRNKSTLKEKGKGTLTETACSVGGLGEVSPIVPVGSKIIVFAHHEAVMSALEQFLRSESVGLVRIDGKVTGKKRDELVKRFQEDNLVSTDVALLSISACGTGLNLTRANVAIFAELHDSLGVLLQAEDRIHRIGQTASCVRILYVIARDSVDRVIWDQMQKKHNVISETVGMDVRKQGVGMAVSVSSTAKNVAVGAGVGTGVGGGSSGNQTSIEDYLGPTRRGSCKQNTNTSGSNGPSNGPHLYIVPSVPTQSNIQHFFTNKNNSTSLPIVQQMPCQSYQHDQPKISQLHPQAHEQDSPYDVVALTPPIVAGVPDGSPAFVYDVPSQTESQESQSLPQAPQPQTSATTSTNFSANNLGVSAPGCYHDQLSSEAKARIESNKLKALEIKRHRMMVEQQLVQNPPLTHGSQQPQLHQQCYYNLHYDHQNNNQRPLQGIQHQQWPYLQNYQQKKLASDQPPHAASDLLIPLCTIPTSAQTQGNSSCNVSSPSPVSKPVSSTRTMQSKLTAHPHVDSVVGVVNFPLSGSVSSPVSGGVTREQPGLVTGRGMPVLLTSPQIALAEKMF